jgi:hypothetical protein
MNGVLNYVKLKAKSKTGFSSSLIVFGMIALAGLVLCSLFLVLAAFIWLAKPYGPLAAALIVLGTSVLVAIVSFVAPKATRRRIIDQADRKLAAMPSLLSAADPRKLQLALTAAKFLRRR